MIKKKLNIIIVSWRGPGHPHAGGAEISTHEHAKGWVKNGHNVTLFTSSYPGAKSEDIIDGVKIIRSGSQVLGVHFKAFLFLLKNHTRFDLIVDQFHGIPFFTPLYLKNHKLAFIHEVTKDVWRLNPWPKPLNLIPWLVGKTIEPLIFKLYKNVYFMTVSQSTKSELIDWGIPSSNIHVIENGVTLKVGKKVKKNKKITITFFGALSRDKGVETALKCFYLLSQQKKDWAFWIVGYGEENYIRHLKKIAGQYNLTHKLKFWGYVSENTKSKLLQRSHLLLNPSIREGWGLVVIEGNMCKTPTVGFNVPGLKDSIKDGKTGILCKQNSASEMSNEIKNLMGDLPRYHSMCNKAHDWASGFDWRASVYKSLKLLNKIV